MQDSRYPIGPYKKPDVFSQEGRADRIHRIATLPEKVRQAVSGLTEEQLNAAYREGGWSVRQVVHHIADASMNSYTRMKLALTEENPTIKPYEEDRWGELADAKAGSVQLSLSILEGLHARWTLMLEALSDADFARTFVHPVGGVSTLDEALDFFTWHGEHHLAHITTFLKSKGG